VTADPLLRSSLKGVASWAHIHPQLPQTPQVQKVTEAWPDGVGASVMPEGKDFNVIATSLLGRDLASTGLTKRELRDSAWCLWHTNPAMAPTSVLAPIMDAFGQSADRQAFRSFASAYLDKFDLGLAGLADVSKQLASKADAAGNPWEGLQREFALFDPHRGPASVSAAALLATLSPIDLLASRGLGTLDANSGYGRACEAAVLRRIAEQSTLDALDRLVLVRRIALISDRALRTDDHAPLVADALVKPFGDVMPEADVQDQYLRILIGLFGDPRLAPGRWARMLGVAQIVKRWLARASLVQFLDVVDKVAVERMWLFRRSFWEAVYRRELIEDAWVAFDWKGTAVAKQAFKDTLHFASLRGVQEGQAVLLLRLRRGLVAEWSHNGKCIIWDDDQTREAPHIYKREYEAAELRSPFATDRLDQPVFAVSHIGSGTYSWQRKVAAKIYRMTGVMISQTEYEVR